MCKTTNCAWNDYKAFHFVTDHSFAVSAICSSYERVFNKVVLKHFPQRCVRAQEIIHHLISANDTIPEIKKNLIINND